MRFSKILLLISSLMLFNACTPIKEHPKQVPAIAQTAVSFNEFCTQNKGSLRVDISGLSVCMTEQGACSGTDYAQGGCANLTQCVQKPADCDPRIPPLAPSFCKEGERQANMDACGCRHGMFCLTKP